MIVKHTLTNGTIYYIDDNRLHQEQDQPALIYSDGSMFWFEYGARHRLTGPAVISANGTQQWWYRGTKVTVTTQEEFEQWLKLKAFQ